MVRETEERHRRAAERRKLEIDLKKGIIVDP